LLIRHKHQIAVNWTQFKRRGRCTIWPVLNSFLYQLKYKQTKWKITE